VGAETSAMESDKRKTVAQEDRIFDHMTVLDGDFWLELV
jgi:hypothetical protein